MKKGIIIGGVIIIIIGVIILAISNEEIKDTKIVEEIKDTKIVEEIKDTKQKSGPFQINKSEYKLGEKIFLVVDGLQDNDKGEIIFLKATSSTQYLLYDTIPFDGKMKHTFNQYVEPKLLKEIGVCKAEQLIGDWAIWFKGTEYSILNFKMKFYILLRCEKFKLS